MSLTWDLYDEKQRKALGVYREVIIKAEKAFADATSEVREAQESRRELSEQNYEREIAPAKKIMDEEIKAAEIKFWESIEPFTRARDETWKELDKEFDELIRPHWKIYSDTLNPAREEYLKSCSVFWLETQRGLEGKAK